MKEILTVLSEECAEVVQASSKLIRFGVDDPRLLHNLETEIADVMAMIVILMYNGVISEDGVLDKVPNKLRKLQKYSNIECLDDIIENL